VDDLLSPSDGSYRLRMILNRPQWFRGVTNAHHDSSVLRPVVGPRQLFEVRTARNVDMKGMVSNRLDGANVLEQVFGGVVYLGNETMFHD